MVATKPARARAGKESPWNQELRPFILALGKDPVRMQRVRPPRRVSGYAPLAARAPLAVTGILRCP